MYVCIIIIIIIGIFCLSVLKFDGLFDVYVGKNFIVLNLYIVNKVKIEN